MKGSFLIFFITFVVSGCASLIGTETKFYHWQSNDIYQGKGGAVELYEGTEFWASGEPSRRYKVIGLIDQKLSEDSMDKAIFGDFNKRQLTELVKEHGGDGVIIVSKNNYVSGATAQAPINQYAPAQVSVNYSSASRYAVFKYVD